MPKKSQRKCKDKFKGACHKYMVAELAKRMNQLCTAVTSQESSIISESHKSCEIGRNNEGLSHSTSGIESYSGSLCSCSCDEEESSEGIELETDNDPDDISDSEESKVKARVKTLLMQNAKARLMLSQAKQLNEMLSTQKFVRQQQLLILQRANSLNSMFVRNMETIMRLGFCAVSLQEQTDQLSSGLIRVNKMIHSWDDRISNYFHKTKAKKSMLEEIFKTFGDKFGDDLAKLSDDEFKSLCCDFQYGINKFSENFNEDLLQDDSEDTLNMDSDWDTFEAEVEHCLLSMEREFIEVCARYGVRQPLPKVDGCEWAYAVGNDNLVHEL